MFFQNTRAGSPGVFLIIKTVLPENKFCQSVHYFNICAFLMPQGTKTSVFSFQIAKQQQLPPVTTKVTLLWFSVNPPFSSRQNRDQVPILIHFKPPL